MEFRFNLNEMFKEPIVEIGNTMVPPGFAGDKRALWDAQTKITQIVNAMGEASANAQGLTKPITTADRLRNSEHKLYLLLDQSANHGKGAVTGMLKVGEKGLYVFDREGQHYQVSPPCVLDFYVHESKQRSGYGKRLFEHMLEKEHVEPVRMAIDRPSDKLLGFLNKHYGLNNPVKQMNNYVVYDGFFPKFDETPRTLDTDKSTTPGKKQSANGLQQFAPSSPYGRYGAPRPPCSMGQIIHNDSAVLKRNQEPTGVRSEPVTNIHGQHVMYTSEQLPAWQVTQSAPSIPYSYNPQNPTQFPQYPQYQRYPQNYQYPVSGGDHVPPQQQAQYQVTTTQSHNNQVLQPHGYNYYANYPAGQGDATQQSYGDKTSYQPPYQLASNPAVAPLPQNFQQSQAQNYYYPQNQQYQVPGQYQQNIASGMTQVPQTYSYQQVPEVQKAPQLPQGGGHPYSQQKEPLIPQNVQMSASMPLPRTEQQVMQNLMPLHGTVSAPVSYQQRSDVVGQQGQPAVDTRAYNVASAPQVAHQQSPAQDLLIADRSTYKLDTVSKVGVQNISGNASIQQPQNVAYSQPTQNVQQVPSLPHVTASLPQQNPQAPQLNNAYTQQVQNPQQIGSRHQFAAPLQDHNLQQQNMAYVQQFAPATLTGLGNAHHPSVQPQNPVVHQQNMAYTPTVPPSQNAHFPQGGEANFGVGQVNLGTVAPPVAPGGSYSMQPAAMPPQIRPQSSVQREPQYNQMEAQYHQHVRPVSATPPVGGVTSQHPQHSLNEQRVADQNETGSKRSPEDSTAKDRSSIEAKAKVDNKAPSDVDLSKGYPPQLPKNIVTSRPPIVIRNYEKPALNSTPKADRPQSLNIELADDQSLKDIPNDQNDDNNDAEEPVGGEGEAADSLDGDQVVLYEIEEEFEKIEVAPVESAVVTKKSPVVEAAGIVTPGRNTPGLTEQGYFDLKFYHNKLW